jgi:1-acyl-sn-glycerol-3-phosphate acyltransferase
MGYHHIRVKGRRDPRAHIIVCNHVTFIDPIVLVSQFTPMFVAAAENLKKPGIGDFFRVTQGIPFDRSDRQSCISVWRCYIIHC